MLLSKKWLKTNGGYEDWRDFWSSLDSWADQYDFTYKESILNNQNKMLLEFLACDFDYGEGLDTFKNWDNTEKVRFKRQAIMLGLELPKYIENYKSK